LLTGLLNFKNSTKIGLRNKNCVLTLFYTELRSVQVGFVGGFSGGGRGGVGVGAGGWGFTRGGGRGGGSYGDDSVGWN
jgi:hypothetical protein